MHRLLRRQIRKFLPKDLPEKDLSLFLEAVDQAYKDFDADIRQAENTLELSSQELFKVNNELRQNVADKSEEARKLASRLQRIVDSVQEVIFQTDIDGKWTFLNSAWEKITGFSVEESLGTSFTKMVYPEDKEISMYHLADLVNGDEQTSRYTLRYVTKLGSIRWTEAMVSLDLDDEGRLLGASGTLTDITSRYQAEEQSRKLSENLTKAQSLAKIGSWEYPISLDKPGYWSRQTYAILGKSINSNHQESLDEFLSFFKHEDQSIVMEALKSMQKGGKSFNQELAIEVKGETKWVDLKAEVLATNGSRKNLSITGSIMEITDRKNFENELIKAKLMAEEALAAKSEFLSNMSHEIRTPMNAIIGLTEILLKRPLSKEDRENLELIEYSADNLLVIINDILDYSKIEANKVSFEHIPFNLHELLTKLVKTLHIKAVSKSIRLDLVGSEDIPNKMLIGDPYRLNQVLLNLLSNAIKFTNVGEVLLKTEVLEIHDQRVGMKFSVKDTGIGISKDKQSSIFESFTQAYTDTTRNFGGTGLGLAISKRLIELQGGSIGLESELGQGSEFYFYLNFDLGEPLGEEVSPASDQSASKLTAIDLLVAEDNKVNQLLIKQVCRNWNANVEIVSDGMQVVEKSKSREYDIILMDLQMPKKNGYDALKDIRGNQDNPNVATPILALTADALPETRQKVIEQGFSSHVTKPFRSQELYEQILKCLGD